MRRNREKKGGLGGLVLKVGGKKINICFFFFFSRATSDALESSQRARTHLSWGQRERETCDFSLY